jgi:signal peptidase II
LRLKRPKGKIALGKKVVLLILSVLIVDQIVKILIKTQFAPHEEMGIIDGFFQIYYIENRGMAFGTTLGAGALAKYALSIFRLLAIVGIGYYIKKLLKEKDISLGMVLSVGLIFAGAAGNLIDGMFYDYIWELDPDVAWNWALDGNNDWVIAADGNPQMRPNGFLLGSVVDMFQFTATWPSWMPFGLAGEEIFAAIWNIADASITAGVALIIINYKKFFKKPSPQAELVAEAEHENKKMFGESGVTVAEDTTSSKLQEEE